MHWCLGLGTRSTPRDPLSGFWIGEERREEWRGEEGKGWNGAFKFG